MGQTWRPVARRHAVSRPHGCLDRHRDRVIGGVAVFSEILYYFGDGDLDQVLDRAIRALPPGGTLLAVHWRHPVAGYPGTGDDVHQVLAARPGLARLVRHAEPDFLAEVYIRTDAAALASVAQATGLV
jgi:hypothetical protein